jgi:hypothetical protein
MQLNTLALSHFFSLLITGVIFFFDQQPKDPTMRPFLVVAATTNIDLAVFCATRATLAQSKAIGATSYCYVVVSALYRNLGGLDNVFEKRKREQSVGDTVPISTL